MKAIEVDTIVQVIINVVIAITAIYAAIMATINQLQMRRQIQRILSVNIKKTIMELPRIPDGGGGRIGTAVHVFVVQVINPGLTPVVMKGAVMILPGDKLLTKGFAPTQQNRWFPMELAPGDDQELHIDVYEVLEAMKGSGITGKVAIQCYIITPIKNFKSKKIHLDIEQMKNDISCTEGKWRK